MKPAMPNLASQRGKLFQVGHALLSAFKGRLAIMKEYVRVRVPHFLLAVIYIGLICFVTFWVIKPRISHTQMQSFSNIHFRATRDLARNHRVRPVDIERPVDLPGSLYWSLPKNNWIEGMYMKKRAGRGEP